MPAKATTASNKNATAKATKAKAKAKAQAPAAPVAVTDNVIHESKRANPVAFVWQYVIKHHNKLGRAECVRQLEKMGVATHTAKTQYQRCHANGYKAKAPATK